MIRLFSLSSQTLSFSCRSQPVNSPLTNNKPEQYLAAARAVFLHRGGISVCLVPGRAGNTSETILTVNCCPVGPHFSLLSPGCHRNCTRFEGRGGSALLALAHCVLFTFVHHLSLLELLAAI